MHTYTTQPCVMLTCKFNQNYISYLHYIANPHIHSKHLPIDQYHKTYFPSILFSMTFIILRLNIFELYMRSKSDSGASLTLQQLLLAQSSIRSMILLNNELTRAQFIHEGSSPSKTLTCREVIPLNIQPYYSPFTMQCITEVPLQVFTHRVLVLYEV